VYVSESLSALISKQNCVSWSDLNDLNGPYQTTHFDRYYSNVSLCLLLVDRLEVP